MLRRPPRACSQRPTCSRNSSEDRRRLAWLLAHRAARRAAVYFVAELPVNYPLGRWYPTLYALPGRCGGHEQRRMLSISGEHTLGAHGSPLWADPRSVNYPRLRSSTRRVPKPTCPWRGNARPTRLSPAVAAGGPPVGPWGRSGPSWPMSVSVTTRGNHPGRPTVVPPLPLRPTAVTPLVAHRLAGRRCVVPRCVRAWPGGCLAL